uniref:Uncharacterized protein n=1 Tax=Dinoroseobacter phage vB_DshS_R26L TaxID=3161158 RepID=A0AAU7VGG5_9CAUD
MSTDLAQQQPPRGEGLMIVNGDSAVVFGTPGMVHGQFFATVKHLKAEHVKAGSPQSNQGF